MLISKCFSLLDERGVKQQEDNPRGFIKKVITLIS